MVGSGEIIDIESLEEVLRERITFFDEIGCRASDHGFDYMMFRPTNRKAVDVIFKKIIKGERPTLEETDDFLRTILYSLNPSDNRLLDSIIGSFQGSEIPGKIQHGSAWWFNDTKRWLLEQLESLAKFRQFRKFRRYADGQPQLFKLHQT